MALLSRCTSVVGLLAPRWGVRAVCAAPSSSLSLRLSLSICITLCFTPGLQCSGYAKQHHTCRLHLPGVLGDVVSFVLCYSFIVMCPLLDE